MNANNPKYILRNYIAQNAIEEAERGNFLEVSGKRDPERNNGFVCSVAEWLQAQ